MIIKEYSYPRGALIGNPSDGYFGRTIAMTFANFHAEVLLYESPELEILPDARDHSVFSSISALADDVKLFGYYGGIRLLKATVRRFADYCRREGIALHDRNFTIRYASNIPRSVGLAGSSAIITACMRTLTRFYGVAIPKPVFANLVLGVEKDELRISAGLQDRVAQAFQGLVYMDFNKDLMARQGYGRYEELDAALLPPVYIAYRGALAETSDVYHHDLRSRYEQRDPQVLEAIAFWADLTEKVKAALLARTPSKIAPLMDANFDRRALLYKISPGNLQMVESARSVGASANFTGSGGAIIGTYEDEAMFQRLKQKLNALGIEVIKPAITPPVGD